MNDLQAWKEALEKHGMSADASPYGMVGPYGSISVQYPPSDAEPTNDAWEVYIQPRHDDHDAAEFISRVTEFVFGQWAYYQSLAPAENDAIIWALMEPDDAGDLLVASGLTKLETLLNALQTKEAAL